MAMRLLTPEEFDSELIRRGCRKQREHPIVGHVWTAPDGRIFLVPAPAHLGVSILTGSSMS